MASFTDKISTFNPYISQLPVEAMVKVGVQKQQQYDQGVQKIQGQIDNIAGMDVMRSVDKQALQSKLNELGSKLKTVAAGDFSNQQLVNSVGGMASSIVKDPSIQNAVASTQRARTELNTANTLYKEGKSALRNVNYLYDQVNQYANSTDPNATFNGKYTNYVDLNKKYMGIADDLKKNAGERSVDQPYRSDAQGNTIYYTRDKNGNVLSASLDPKSGGVPEPDITMKKFTIKGVSSQTMYDAIKSSITGDDMEQLKIDAWDHYKGKGPESVITDLATTNNLAQTMLKTEIQKLKVDLQDKTLTADEKKLAQININKYETKLNDGSFDKELADQIIALNNPSNLENEKFNSYLKKTLNTQAAILSNQSYKEELVASPIEAATLARQKFQQQIINDNRTYTLQKSNSIETQKQHAIENDQWLKTWKDKHPGIVTQNMPLSTNIVAPTTNSLSKNIETLQDNITKLGNDYSVNLGLDKAGLDDLYNRYIKNPNSVTEFNAVAYVTARSRAELAIVRKNNLKKLVEEGITPFDTKIDKVLINEPGLTNASGQQIFSAKDLYEVKNLVVNNSKSIHTGAGHYESSINSDAIFKAVGNNPQKLAIATALIKKYKNDPTLTSTENSIYNKSLSIANKVGGSIGKIVEDKAKYQSDTIAKYDTYYQQQVGTIDPKNESDMSRLDNVIGNAIALASVPGYGIDLSSGQKFNVDNLAKMRAKGADGKINVSANIIKNYDGSALIEVHQGSAVETIPLTAGDFAKFYPDYVKSNPFTEDFAAVAVSKNKTTNTGQGPGNTEADAVTAAHTGYEIPGLRGTPWENNVRYDIIGDVHNDGGEDDRFGITLFINHNNKWIPVTSLGGPKSGASVQQDIEENIGPDTINRLVKKYNK
jgi:hypothetical protein